MTSNNAFEADRESSGPPCARYKCVRGPGRKSVVAGRSTRSLAVMRMIIHAISIAVAILTLVLLIPSVRAGETTVLAGMIQPVIALFVTYVLLIVIVGVVYGVPPAKWLMLAKQLFRGRGEA